MAKIINSSIDKVSSSKAYSIWKIALVGILLGIIYWGLTSFINNYSHSIDIASNVATIIVATLGIIVMLYLRMARPLLVAIATAVSLWGLALYTYGFVWYEAAFWSALLYGLSYALYLWITKYKTTLIVIIAIVIILIILRIVIKI